MKPTPLPFVLVSLGLVISCVKPDPEPVNRTPVARLTTESSKGYPWEGAVTFVEGSCGTLELTLSKGGLSSPGKIYLSGKTE